MSTRSNIVFVKKDYQNAQLYHHSDGYPDGVGAWLTEHYFSLSEKEQDELTTPEKCAKELNAWDDSFEIEDCALHGDIEYLYVINLDEESITCYSVDIWDDTTSDEEIISGKSNVSPENVKQVYSVSMWTEPEELADTIAEYYNEC